MRTINDFLFLVAFAVIQYTIYTHCTVKLEEHRSNIRPNGSKTVANTSNLMVRRRRRDRQHRVAVACRDARCFAQARALKAMLRPMPIPTGNVAVANGATPGASDANALPAKPKGTGVRQACHVQLELEVQVHETLVVRHVLQSEPRHQIQQQRMVVAHLALCGEKLQERLPHLGRRAQGLLEVLHPGLAAASRADRVGERPRAANYATVPPSHPPTQRPSHPLTLHTSDPATLSSFALDDMLAPSILKTVTVKGMRSMLEVLDRLLQEVRDTRGPRPALEPN